MTELRPMIKDEDDDEEIYSISRILKDIFGKNFETASLSTKLYLVEAIFANVKLDRKWNQMMAPLHLDTLEFPETFEDTQEAMELIQCLIQSMASDMTSDDLPIGGLR